MRIRPLLLATAVLGASALATGCLRRGARRLDLAGRVVVITGGARGLGYAIARECAEHGARLALCARDLHELDAAAAALREAGVEVLTAVCDAADPAQVSAFVAEVQTRLGPIDVLINNAGQCYVGPAASLSAADVEDAMRNIFWVQVQPTLAVLPQMRARGQGRIVFISSIGGKIPVAHMAAYTAAKHALVGWAQTLAVELAREGVRVSAVAPPPLRDGAALFTHFFGDTPAEFRWFTLATTAPLLSARTERAARAAVDAARHGDVERTVSFVSWLAARAQGLFPGLTVRVMRAIEALLPRTPEGLREPARLGAELARSADATVTRALGKVMREQARRYRPADSG